MAVPITKDDVVLLPIAVATVAGRCITLTELKEVLFYVITETRIGSRYPYLAPKVGQIKNTIIIEPDFIKSLERLKRKKMIEIREVEYRGSMEEEYCATEEGVKRATYVAQELKNAYGEGDFVALLVAKASGGKLALGKLFG